MSSSSSQTMGSPSESPARERSTTRDTSVTIESNNDGKHIAQATKKARKPPTKNTEALNGGKPWNAADRFVLWELRGAVDVTASKRDQVIAHNKIGAQLGRSGQACRIQLCSVRKNAKLRNLHYALHEPSSPQPEEAAKKAKAQPEKKPSEKARIQPEKRPSAKARAPVILRLKKPSEKVEAQPQKPLPVFSPSTIALSPSPIALSPSPVASSPASVAQSSGIWAKVARWRMNDGSRDRNDIVSTSSSEPSSPKQEACLKDDAQAESEKVEAAQALLNFMSGDDQHRPTASIDYLIGDRDAES